MYQCDIARFWFVSLHAVDQAKVENDVQPLQTTRGNQMYPTWHPVQGTPPCMMHAKVLCKIVQSVRLRL